MTNKSCCKHQKLDSLNSLFLEQKIILKGKCVESRKICSSIQFYLIGLKIFYKIQ